jgi:hypothetical protein
MTPRSRNGSRSSPAPRSGSAPRPPTPSPPTATGWRCLRDRSTGSPPSPTSSATVPSRSRPTSSTATHSGSEPAANLLQQETAATNARDLAVPDAPFRGWPGTNGARRGPLRHFASSGLIRSGLIRTVTCRVPNSCPIPRQLLSLTARHGQHFPLHVRSRLAREPPVSSSKLVMRIRFVLLLYDRPLSLRDLGL